MINIISFFLFVGVLSSPPNEDDYYYPVSLIHLIVVPEQFQDKKVVVHGYFQIGIFTKLYLGKEQADIFDTDSAITIQDNTAEGTMSELCDGKYVEVTGLFALYEKSYELQNIERILDVKALKPCWERDNSTEIQEKN